MKNRPIVIIGGMGPQASLLLHSKLLSKSRQHHTGQPNEYPDIIHFSLQIPEFFSNADEEALAVEIINQRLNRVRLPKNALICMPCNTAHKLLPGLQLQSAEFVSMVEAVKMHIQTMNSGKIGILASPNTLQSGFYEDVVRDCGKTPILPRRKSELRLAEIISSVIKDDRDPSIPSKLNHLIIELQKDGAAAVLLGCTELSVPEIESDMPIIDSTDILADALIERLLL